MKMFRSINEHFHVEKLKGIYTIKIFFPPVLYFMTVNLTSVHIFITVTEYKILFKLHSW